MRYDALFADADVKLGDYCCIGMPGDCACRGMERVAKAHINGRAAEPLTDEQRAALLADTDDNEPGEAQDYPVDDPDRDEKICRAWWSSLCSYVDSMR